MSLKFLECHNPEPELRGKRIYFVALMDPMRDRLFDHLLRWTHSVGLSQRHIVKLGCQALMKS